MSLQRTYYPAKKCSSGSRPGARELMSWFLGAYGPRGGTNLGIYNCRLIPGSNSLSVHGEGRADDLGTPANSWSQAVADALVANSAELGIQLVIHNRKVWSANYPDAGWRKYTGSNPHTDHIHAELTPDSAASLTVARINAVLSGGNTPPGTGENWTEELVDNLPTVRLGHHDPKTVKTVQAIVNRDKTADDAALLEDGVWGPKTDNAVRNWQARNNVPKSVRSDGTGDGAFGRACWTFALDLA